MQPLTIATCETSYGTALIGLRGDALGWLTLGDVERQRESAARRHVLVEGASHPRLATIATALRAGSDLAYVAVEQVGTPFQQRVWAAIRTIPRGETRSYADLARLLDSGPRAIGGACGRNRVAIAVPCHRVVQADGSLGGFGYGGLAVKRALLDAERQPLRLAAA